jgi:hypothetical protein
MKDNVRVYFSVSHVKVPCFRRITKSMGNEIHTKIEMNLSTLFLPHLTLLIKVMPPTYKTIINST